MRNDEIQCLRCQKPMQRGFIADSAHSGYVVQSRWTEGSPVNSKFLGMNTGTLDIKNRETFPTIAYRCPECFHVEIFAIPEEQERNILLRPAGKGQEQGSEELLRGSEAPKREEREE